uniref:Uncharacterized protein n=1 Tax=Timema bartmani TaxID=61472 RepID=A0A7R9F2L7_9NEOP|nr:unnamed protein product [Timema bartmani]
MLIVSHMKLAHSIQFQSTSAASCNMTVLLLIGMLLVICCVHLTWTIPGEKSKATRSQQVVIQYKRIPNLLWMLANMLVLGEPVRANKLCWVVLDHLLEIINDQHNMLAELGGSAHALSNGASVELRSAAWRVGGSSSVTCHRMAERTELNNRAPALAR